MYQADKVRIEGSDPRMEHCGVPVETQATSPVIKMSYESFEYKSRKTHCTWMSPCRPVRLQGFDISLCLQLKCACVDLGVHLRVDTGWHQAGSKRFPLHGPVVSALAPPLLCWPAA